MPRIQHGGAVAVAAVLALVGSASSTAPTRAPARPLVTGVYFDTGDEVGPQAAMLFKRAKQEAGAGIARFTVYWADVAPQSLPTSWNPSDPADPHYDWHVIDTKVRHAAAVGLQPLITIMQAPAWAQTPPGAPPPNSHLPDPQQFALFAKAIATRYDGSFHGLPRVRFWQAWNEPNLSLYLIPQLQDRKPVSPGWYRQMLNGFYDAVHSVQPDAVVVSGGLAPFRDVTDTVMAQNTDWGPLSFMRELLCISPTLQPTCTAKTKFDAWAQHPYTSGGPLHKAVMPNDASLGNLPQVRAILAAAERAGHIVSSRPVQFWVSEFSWDTNPPDSQAVPVNLATRWVAEALYRMWANGVSVVVWLAMRDEPIDTSFYQSGLYFRGPTVAQDRPKPLLTAFRFPVVALPVRSGVFVWGRTPWGRPSRVMVERSSREGWARLAVLATNRFGIFERTFRTSKTGSIRARLLSGHDASVPFGIKPVPDHFYNPFGNETLEPNP